MKNWEEAVVLRPGEHIVVVDRKTKGTLQETDIIFAEVHDRDGNTTSRIKATDHTAIKGFEQTVSVEQVSSDGKVLVDKTW